MSSKICLFMGALLGGLSVLFGAFGAHYLKTRLSQEMLTIFEVGVRYQMYHALALCIIAVAGVSSYLSYSALAMFLGTLLFSGSLYLLVFTEVRQFGAITPIGGLLMTVGWVLLGVYSFQMVSNV